MMLRLPNHPAWGMEDSPTFFKPPSRVRRRRSSSPDIEPQPAPKRRYRKKRLKGRVEAKLETQLVQAGGGSDPDSESYCSPRTKSPPLRKPLGRFTSPQKSRQQALETPTPAKSVRIGAYPTSSFSPGRRNFPSTPVRERIKPSGRTLFLGPGHVSPGHVHSDTKVTTPTPNERRRHAIEHRTSSSASNARPLGAGSRRRQINASKAGSIIRIPLETLSSTNSSSNNQHPQSLSGQTLFHTLNGSARKLEMEATEWQPAGLLSMDQEEPESEYALLVLNQPIQNLNMLRLVWKKAFFRIAADGGANRLSDAFRDPCLMEDYDNIGLEVICGDLDSLLSEVRADALRRGTTIVEDPDQNSTDFTKCVAYLRKNIFNGRKLTSNIVCLSGLGGRIDQALSQLHHLYMEQKDPNYKSGRIYLLSTEGIAFVLKTGKHRIRVHDPSRPVLGKHIGIIPLKTPSVITTKGLKWDVTAWPTEFGVQISTSNHVRDDVVEIHTTADVLFTIDLDFPLGNHDHHLDYRREM